MKLKLFLYIFLSFLFSQEETVQLENKIEEVSGPDHISMLVHEDLINEFFKNMGMIVGGGKNYEWRLKNPRIIITEEKAIFKAEIQVASGILSSTHDVIGKVDVRYDQENNLIIIEVIKADVIIDIAGFDIGKINIGKHFSKPLILEGPRGVSEHVEFELPSGKIRTIDVSVKSYSLNLIEGAIKVSTSLGFKVVEK
tara:strand:+ start:235 stop:825 length:591 start_codon:yes stop_codon:yes gene_type:complete